MARLVLLNGPPASGKSTLATQLVRLRPMSLNLDIDLIRAQLGAWTDSPAEAGVAARRLAVAMATTHLAEGLDVVVPQFLAREQFIVDLADTAQLVGAAFVEIALIVTRAETIDAFAGSERITRQSAASRRARARRTVRRARCARRDVRPVHGLTGHSAERPPDRSSPW